MKLAFTMFGVALLALAAVCAVNVRGLPVTASPVPAAPPAALDADAAADRLAAALRIATVSHEDRARVDNVQFARLANLLRRQFPRTHRVLAREVVNGNSLLYTWPATDPQSSPLLLLAHMDVVPVEPGTEKLWTQPPFAGVIADGFVWGRGALDDKSSLMAQLEAVEHLVAAGFRPARTVYLAFGHDEEIGGDQGAKRIAALLASRGIKAEFALDEGGAILKGVVKGIERPVASIMAAEKGYASFRLTARAAGGHSSQPPPVTAVGRVARAVARLQAEPLPARLQPPITDMLDRLAAEMPSAQRVAMANRWLFGPMITRSLAKTPLTDALVRTTTAPTVFHAGVKDNVLPAEAYAIVNFRVLPGDSIATVEQHIRDTIQDAEIELALESFHSEPSPVSPTDTPAFRLLERTVGEVFPEAAISTGLVIGATDSRHYGDVWEARYNFAPVTLTAEDVATIHGANERIAVQAYGRMIQFYIRLLQNL